MCGDCDFTKGECAVGVDGDGSREGWHVVVVEYEASGVFHPGGDEHAWGGGADVVGELFAYPQWLLAIESAHIARAAVGYRDGMCAVAEHDGRACDGVGKAGEQCLLHVVGVDGVSDVCAVGFIEAQQIEAFDLNACALDGAGGEPQVAACCIVAGEWLPRVAYVGECGRCLPLHHHDAVSLGGCLVGLAYGPYAHGADGVVHYLVLMQEGCCLDCLCHVLGCAVGTEWRVDGADERLGVGCARCATGVYSAHAAQGDGCGGDCFFGCIHVCFCLFLFVSVCFGEINKSMPPCGRRAYLVCIDILFLRPYVS